jgi:hypothetical protein
MMGERKITNESLPTIVRVAILSNSSARRPIDVSEQARRMERVEMGQTHQ